MRWSKYSRVNHRKKRPQPVFRFTSSLRNKDIFFFLMAKCMKHLWLVFSLTYETIYCLLWVRWTLISQKLPCIEEALLYIKVSQPFFTFTQSPESHIPILIISSKFGHFWQLLASRPSTFFHDENFL